MTDRPTATDSQTGAVTGILISTFIMVPLNLLAAYIVGSSLPAVGGAALAVALMGSAALWLDPKNRNVGVVFALVGEVIVANAAFAGHPWQIDMHMAYFAVLAAVMVLSDARAVIAGAALIAVHHLSLTFLMPTLVYPSTNLVENLERTTLHGLLVVWEAAGLVYAIVLRNRLTAQAVDQAAALEVAVAEAHAARDRAEAALDEARAATGAAQNARAEAEAALARAAAESSKAQEADARAQEVDAREAAKREAFLEQQNTVVEALRKGLRRLRNADLRAAISDELAAEYRDLQDDFNTALKTLREMIAKVQSNATVIGTETESVVTAAADMSTRTEAQAQRLAEIASTVSQINETVAATAENARNAKVQADHTQSEVEHSADLVSRAVAAMGAIEASSSQIQKIVGVIDDISFQTNLLALNAGVEAARAGESGRGFAVVASEVRALAQRSSEAAQEIKSLISESDTRVGEGVALVRKTGEANSEVMTAVHDIVARIVEIAGGAEDQAASLGELDRALAELDRATQHNAAMFEETAAAGQALNSGTHDLIAAIARFRTAEDGFSDVDDGWGDAHDSRRRGVA